jgi:uncharacterized protein YbbC (DUF1343 family)
MKLWLFIFLLFAPQCFAQNIYDRSIKPADAQPEKYVGLLKNKRVGLIINQTSAVGDSSLLDMLLNRHVKVVKIFVPEHGFRGHEDAGAKIDNALDSATNTPIISLYGSHKKPKPEDLEGIDIMVYDLQDVGVRFYTYISSLEYCMEACAENNKEFIVLDKPNPNGFYVDGPVLEKENKSFVGMQSIPIVYGMTCGEYARMLVGEQWFNKSAELNLTVMPCTNYTHKKKYQLPFPPSPNLRTMAAVYAYPSLCLFEGTPISVGRGTDMAFQQYGSPVFEGKFTYSFTPASRDGAKMPPYENKTCYGELIGRDEIEALKAIDNSFRLQWLIKAHDLFPAKDKFFNSFFVKLAGTSSLQTQIENGTSEVKIKKSWQKDIQAFKKKRKKYLLYADFE